MEVRNECIVCLNEENLLYQLLPLGIESSVNWSRDSFLTPILYINYDYFLYTILPSQMV